MTIIWILSYFAIFFLGALVMYLILTPNEDKPADLTAFEKSLQYTKENGYLAYRPNHKW